MVGKDPRDPGITDEGRLAWLSADPRNLAWLDREIARDQRWNGAAPKIGDIRALTDWGIHTDAERYDKWKQENA